MRVALDRFDNYFVIDVRRWRRDRNSVFKPTPTGLRLSVRHLPKLFDGLGEALARAKMFGLIDHSRWREDKPGAQQRRR